MRTRRQKQSAGLTEYFEVHCKPSEKVRLKYLAMNRNMTMQAYVRNQLFGSWSSSGTEAENLKDATHDLKARIADMRRMAKNTLKRKTP